MARRAVVHVGWRGAALLAAAIICAGYGWAIRSDPTTLAHLHVLTHRVPVAVLSWGWLACGAVALVSAILPLGADRIGFMVASLPPAVWAGAYAGLWVGGYYPTGWVHVLPWGGLAAFVILSSRRPEVSLGEIVPREIST